MLEPFHLAANRGFDLLQVEHATDVIFNMDCKYAVLTQPIKSPMRYNITQRHMHMRRGGVPTPFLPYVPLDELEQASITLRQMSCHIFDKTENKTKHRFLHKDVREFLFFHDAIVINATKGRTICIRDDPNRIEQMSVILEAYF